MNDPLNHNLWTIYGISASTAETERYYISAPTIDAALAIFWVLNARDRNENCYEWIISLHTDATDTQPA